jgi:hypothetical protein
MKAREKAAQMAGKNLVLKTSLMVMRNHLSSFISL